VRSVVNTIENLEQVLTLDQAERFSDFDQSSELDGPCSTQQLLDELLGRFEDDGSPICEAQTTHHFTDL
jgi:hypothetical protein